MKTLEERISEFKSKLSKGRMSWNAVGDLNEAMQFIIELQQKYSHLQLEKAELIKALNFIRSSDSSTESAAKAIEMLRKYETI